MKTKAIVLFTAFLVTFTPWGRGQDATFTYQGRVSDTNGALNGTASIVFRLYAAAAFGGPLWLETHPSVQVSNGLFSVTLGRTTPVDENIFDGSPRWLGISVNGSAEMLPRTMITAAPYAITAAHLTGVLPPAGLSGTYSAPLIFDNSANSFTGNGAGLTTLNASRLTAGTVADARLGPNVSLLAQTIESAEITDGTVQATDLNAAAFNTMFWRVVGNAGTTPATHFLGTTDNQALEVRVNNQRALRFEPVALTDTVNVIGGSARNVAAGVGVTIGGGGSGNYSGAVWTNAVFEDFGTIGGGLGNRIEVNAFGSAIGGGWANSVIRSAIYSAITGGRSNTVGLGSDYAVIAGGFYNQIGTNALWSTISGGVGNRVGTNALYASIGAGGNNLIGTNSDFCAIGGGLRNEIGALSDWSAISGGGDNTIERDTSGGTISGGRDNTISRGAIYGTIGGGSLNRLGTNSDASVVGGGEENRIWTFCEYSTIAGGSRNVIAEFSPLSVIAGGNANGIDTNSFGSSIGGGSGNNIGPNAQYATLPGGFNNSVEGEYSFATGRESRAAADYSFALGRRAKALHSGSFVWADSQNADFQAPLPNSMAFRCQGGVLFTSGTAGANQNIQWFPGLANWAVSSDRNLKDRFASIQPREILNKVSRLALSEWSFKGHSQRHIGPMAQDFHALFPLNDNDKMIDTGDLHGVALAAIQGLNQKLEERLKEKDAEIRELRESLADLKAAFKNLANKSQE